MNNHIIKTLLEEYKKLADRLNEVNEKINESGADGEDIIPGHDEGADYHALLAKYNIYLEQAKNIKKQLNDLGYNKV
jgi:cytochrome c